MNVLIVIFLLCISFNTVSANDSNNAKGDPVLGRAKALLCIGCHGIDGNNVNSAYPILAGQGETYLIKQLTDFKTGVRKEEHMSSMVEGLSLSDISNVANYFSLQKREASTLTKSATSDGELIYHNGITSKSVTACSACHAKNGFGNNAAKFPVLAGQHSNYIEKTLKEFRSKKRNNDPNNIMRDIASNLTNKEITAISDYISQMSVQ